MPCESCAVQFTVFKRKRVCCECDRYYCSNCIGRGVGLCGPCKVLSTRPLGRSALDHLRIRDLQCFLHRQNISTRGCVEKEDLINLVLSHVNSGDFSRRPPPRDSQSDFASTFASLKGFTNNINNIITTAFDNITSNHGERFHSRRQQNANVSQSSQSRSPVSPEQPRSPLRSEVSQTSPTGGSGNTNRTQQDRTTVIVPECIVTDTSDSNEQNKDAPAAAEQTNTTDCVEIEDLDDDWEFLGQVVDPLPQDSDELIAERSTPIPLRTANRASSEFNLSSRTSDDTSVETSSLKESSFCVPNNVVKRIQLDELTDLSQVENLTVKQLKELLVLNRVDFKGCCERKELLERAKRLWKENTKSREDLDSASTEELCKICMDAPMECVMLECGHIATCIACGKRLSECPLCRQYVVRVVRFFRS